MLTAAGHAEGRVALRRRERRAGPPRQPGAQAHKLFQRDKDYIVRNDEIVIIDEFTGRMMPGRRYSEGLHQALEAKEHVADPAREPDAGLDHLPELFPPLQEARRHDRHGATEAEEFGNIYGLDVVEIPTNLPVMRLDEDDEVYRTASEKYKAIVERDPRLPAAQGPAGAGRHDLDREVRTCWPSCCARKSIKNFQVLNARYHEQEAYIIAAGRRAGRGHHRHQHGRPRHRHPARRQPRHARRARARRHAGRAPSATSKDQRDPRRRRSA